MGVQEGTPSPRYRGSLFGPLLLIALGVLFLLSNAGIITGNVWDLFWRFWPVLFIVGGLDNLWQRQSLVGGVFWTGIGVFLLLANFNLLIWSTWELVARLWPVAFIALGLDIAIGRRTVWGSLAAIVLLVAIMIGVLWYSLPDRGRMVLSQEEVQYPVREVTSAVLVFEPVAGSLKIHAASSRSELVEGVIHLWQGERVRQEFSVKDGAGYLVLSSASWVSGVPGMGSPRGWELGLNPGIPLEIQTKMAAGNVHLDLSGLQISSINAEVAVGNLELRLPSEGRFSVKTSGAIGRTEIIVPAGMALKIRADTGLVAIKVPQGYLRDGKEYTSPGYETASNRVDLVLSQAIGSVEVR